MRINIAYLCKIANSKTFLDFLYSLDIDIYKKYKDDLVNSSGCRLLGTVVSNCINAINKSGKNDKLMEFLVHHYPDAVITDSLFKNYVPNMFTIPHKKIMYSSEADVIDFCSNKPFYRYKLHGGLYYVEYLNKGEEQYAKCKWELPK